MVKLIWTDQAIQDLGDIGNYIAEHSENFAKRTVRRLFERTAILKRISTDWACCPGAKQRSGKRTNRRKL